MRLCRGPYNYLANTLILRYNRAIFTHLANFALLKCDAKPEVGLWAKSVLNEPVQFFVLFIYFFAPKTNSLFDGCKWLIARHMMCQ